MDGRTLWATIAALGLGCAGGDMDGAGGRGDSTRSGGAIGAAGSGSDQDMAAAGTTGAFGNSNTAPPPAAPDDSQDGAGGDGCVVGQFCAPTDPDPDDCGSLTLESEVEVIQHPGNVLLVFDRSGSMAEEWNGETRWETAGAAIRNALMPLAELLTIGSVFFPSSDPDAPAQCVDPTGITCIFLPDLVVPAGTCGVNAISEPDQINFVAGPDFLTAFEGASGGAPLYAPIPRGFTPLKEGLQQAQAALSSGTLNGITSVIVITDGDPNCEWDAAVSRQIVTDWQAAGIETHVIGLPGLSGDGEAVLNELAAAGGTGTYITPDDASALEQQLRQIAMETVRSGFDSCEITINPAAAVPDELHLVITENGADMDVPRDLADDFSWNITADGSLVTLEGRLCDDATAGRFEALRFEFGCVELPPLEPPPPVE